MASSLIEDATLVVSEEGEEGQQPLLIEAATKRKSWPGLVLGLALSSCLALVYGTSVWVKHPLASVSSNGVVSLAVAFNKVGDGGCSTAKDRYPSKFIDRVKGEVSKDDCQSLCTSSPDCVAYEFKSSRGDCKLHPSTEPIVDSNKFPGVECFKRDAPSSSPYKLLGIGGCSSSSSKFQKGAESYKDVADASSCSRMCDDYAGCTAFEFCAGNSCRGDCHVHTEDSPGLV